MPSYRSGGKNNCWVHTDVGILNVLLQEAGLLSKKERLSVDYYTYVYEARSDVDYPGGFSGVEGMIRKYGIVTEQQFISKPPDLNPLKIPPAVPPAQVQELKFLQSTVFNGLTSEIAWVDGAVSAESLKSVLGAIRNQLDRGIPVHGLFEVNTDWFRRLKKTYDPDGWRYNLRLNHRGYNYIVIPHDMIGMIDRSPWVDHSLQIVGYGLDEKGEISRLLLKNSWGRKFGENGYFNADLSFIKSYMGGARLLNWEQIQKIPSQPK